MSHSDLTVANVARDDSGLTLILNIGKYNVPHSDLTVANIAWDDSGLTCAVCA